MIFFGKELEARGSRRPRVCGSMIQDFCSGFTSSVLLLTFSPLLSPLSLPFLRYSPLSSLLSILLIYSATPLPRPLIMFLHLFASSPSPPLCLLLLLLFFYTPIVVLLFSLTSCQLSLSCTSLLLLSSPPSLFCLSEVFLLVIIEGENVTLNDIPDTACGLCVCVTVCINKHMESVPC